MNRQAADDRKRLLVVTPGNLRQSHLYVNAHFDFFPKSCIGPPRKSVNGNGHQIEITLDGLNETVKTDIGANAAHGKAAKLLSRPNLVRRFFEHHKVHAGDELALERLDGYRYRLSVKRTNGNGHAFKAAEFFAGIGLVRLALEHQGWTVAFANDIEEDKAEMYRHNWPNDDHLVVGDIHYLNAKDIPTCDLFTASFPCNDLSIAGRWEGLSGKESSAFWGLVEIIRAMGKRRPPLILLENVVGFLMSDGGRDFEKALRSLSTNLAIPLMQ